MDVRSIECTSDSSTPFTMTWQTSTLCQVAALLLPSSPVNLWSCFNGASGLERWLLQWEGEKGRKLSYRPKCRPKLSYIVDLYKSMLDPSAEDREWCCFGFRSNLSQERAHCIQWHSRPFLLQFFTMGCQTTDGPSTSQSNGIQQYPAVKIDRLNLSPNFRVATAKSIAGGTSSSGFSVSLVLAPAIAASPNCKKMHRRPLTSKYTQQRRPSWTTTGMLHSRKRPGQLGH